MTAEWYILVEEDTRETRSADGQVLRLHHWQLAATHHVEGGEEQAAAAAEELALHYTPALLARHARPGDEPARRAFLGRDGSWVVRVEQRQRACHIRVSTARLMHTEEEVDAPKESFKDKLRQAFRDPDPSL
ncbi:hypothetical protein OH779_40700 [Actinacidiphila glaucinigra]|uniref:hypothetical protein n=1 Tax=Actinacidiphila glaucinigra TaxID=235986 RepID=UPI00386C77BD